MNVRSDVSENTLLTRLAVTNDPYEVVDLLRHPTPEKVNSLLLNPNLGKGTNFVYKLSTAIPPAVLNKIAEDEDTYSRLPAKILLGTLSTAGGFNAPTATDATFELFRLGKLPLDTVRLMVNGMSAKTYEFFIMGTSDPVTLRELAWQAGIYTPEEETEWGVSIQQTGYANAIKNRELIITNIMLGFLMNVNLPEELVLECMRRLQGEGSHYVNSIMISPFVKRKHLSNNIVQALINSVQTYTNFELLVSGFTSWTVSQQADLLERCFFEKYQGSSFLRSQIDVEELMTHLKHRLYVKAEEDGFDTDLYPLEWLVETFSTGKTEGYRYLLRYNFVNKKFRV